MANMETDTTKKFSLTDLLICLFDYLLNFIGIRIFLYWVV